MNRRKAAIEIRRMLSRTPMSVHRALTHFVMTSITGHLMSDSEVLYCENHPEAIEARVAKHMKKHPSRSSKLHERIDAIFAENERLANASPEDLVMMRTDMLFCYFAYGVSLEEYVYLDFPESNRDVASRRSIASDLDHRIVRFCCNDLTNVELSDKYSEYKTLSQYYKRDVLLLDENTSGDDFHRFIDKHPRFVAKDIYGSLGQGVEVVDIASDAGYERMIQLLETRGILLEELIEQTAEMASFNPDSVNTVRLQTFFTREGVVVPWGFFRTGREGSFVDNCGAGGVFATIDAEAGVVSTCGCDERGNRYTRHPDSDVTFEGFVLPDWPEALELVHNAALAVPDLKYLSWDLAHTERHGWVVVEVNTTGEFIQQVGTLRGVKAELSDTLGNIDLVLPCKFSRSYE